MSTQVPRKAHCIGIGGIHLSAVAKLLMSRGVSVSGSDAFENDETRDLAKRGASVVIGHDAANLPADVDAVIYSHAVPEDNVEFVEAKKRGIECVDTHAYLARMFEGAEQVVVTGSHGKSTTTAMLGLILAACGADPTVVVGTKCAGFPDGNLRIGRDDLLVVEGDEYQRHVLSYAPTVLVLNNIDLDHVDVYPTIEDYEQVFVDVIERMVEGGTIIWNADDARCSEVVKKGKKQLSDLKEIGVCAAGDRIEQNNEAKVFFGGSEIRSEGYSKNHLIFKIGEKLEKINLQIPGRMNARNAAMALTAAQSVVEDLGSEFDIDCAGKKLAAFTGCWRRFERIGSYRGAIAISDYGHHPTEVAATLAAAHERHPKSRIILAFQPHHRNRTKNLFDEFVASFDGADALLLVEIYDVPGREASEDADVSSAKLVDAVKKRDAEAGKTRTVIFVPKLDDLAAALDAVGVTEKDVVIFMGAGAIDATARQMATQSKE